MSNLILSIDPGLTGAWALFEERGNWLAVGDMPAVHDGALGWVNGVELQSNLMAAIQGRPTIAVIERVTPMPKQGVTSMFNFGVAFGSTLGVLSAMHLRIELVSPLTWKRGLGLVFSKEVTQTERKRASLDKARILFPLAPLELAKHHGRAEALLLGYWFIERRNLRKAA